jgi:hypothetical protein
MSGACSRRWLETIWPTDGSVERSFDDTPKKRSHNARPGPIGFDQRWSLSWSLRSRLCGSPRRLQGWRRPGFSCASDLIGQGRVHRARRSKPTRRCGETRRAPSPGGTPPSRPEHSGCSAGHGVRDVKVGMEGPRLGEFGYGGPPFGIIPPVARAWAGERIERVNGPVRRHVRRFARAARSAVYTGVIGRTSRSPERV